MTEQTITKEDFIKFILEGSTPISKTSSSTIDSALPEGIEGFDVFPEEEIQPTTQDSSSSFAERLLRASGFGLPDKLQRENVIRSNDPVARYLPGRVSYWSKTTSRPYQTLLFEFDDQFKHRKLLEIPTFKNRLIDHLDIVEDALARTVSEALKGFQTGGETVTADVHKGNKDETLCVVSILDERTGEPVRLICFGTWNKLTDGLETFQITQPTHSWKEPQEYLGLLYERQFRKLIGQDWKEAFTRTDERKQAEKLLEICTREQPSQTEIRECVLELLEKIAKNFGLKKKIW